MISFQSFGLIRTANLFGSNVGRLTMASTSPRPRIERHHRAVLVVTSSS